MTREFRDRWVRDRLGRFQRVLDVEGYGVASFPGLVGRPNVGMRYTAHALPMELPPRAGGVWVQCM